jgi:hypothetical protein
MDDWYKKKRLAENIASRRNKHLGEKAYHVKSKTTKTFGRVYVVKRR